MLPELTKPLPRIAIVGVGQVGGAAAYALVIASIASELLLIDSNIDLRDGQVRDLSDVAFGSNSSTRVRGASYREASQCDVVIVTAGSRVTMGQTTFESTNRNLSILRNVIGAMTPFGKDTILIILANPVDLLTSVAMKLSNLPASQVLGSGTFLDSVRLRGLLADRMQIASSSIDLYVLGVRGDSQVSAWSAATVGGVPIDKSLPSQSSVERAELEMECKHRSRDILRAKGSMPFGIGAIASSICTSILVDKRNVRPVSCFQSEFGCCFSMPVVLGRKGIISMIQMPLDSGEKEKIAESAKELRRQLDHVHQDL